MKVLQLAHERGSKIFREDSQYAKAVSIIGKTSTEPQSASLSTEMKIQQSEPAGDKVEEPKTGYPFR